MKVDTHQTDKLSVPYQFFFRHPILDFLYCPSLNELICFAVYIKLLFLINYILFKTGIFLLHPNLPTMANSLQQVLFCLHQYMRWLLWRDLTVSSIHIYMVFLHIWKDFINHSFKKKKSSLNVTLITGDEIAWVPIRI